MKEMTHWGVVKGCDARTPANYKRKVKLRETKLYWVTESGTKYSKKRYGNLAGETWPMFALDLSSVHPLTLSKGGS